MSELKRYAVIDITELERLRDGALAESGYHGRNAEYRRKTSNGVLGESEEVLSMQHRKAHEFAASCINFILKNDVGVDVLRTNTSPPLTPDERSKLVHRIAEKIYCCQNTRDGMLWPRIMSWDEFKNKATFLQEAEAAISTIEQRYSFVPKVRG